MTRKLRLLGVATIAVLAASALSAQAALAVPEFTGFNTNTKVDEASTVTGTQTAEHEYTLSAGATPIKCQTVGLTGTAASTDTSLKLTPSWSNCSINKGLNPVDVRVNGCEYKFAIGAKEMADVYSGTFDIVCPAGKSIEFEVTTEMGALRKCLDTIHPQSSVGPVVYTDDTKSAPADLTITLSTTNLANTTDDEIAKCGVKQELHKDGVYKGTTTVQAVNAKKEGIDFTVVG